MDASQGNRKAILLVFIVFVLGIALGGVATYMVTSRVLAARPQTAVHSPADAVAKLTRDLSLIPDQQKQIEAILNDTRSRYNSIHQKIDPEYEQVRQEGRERIRQVLTPDQRTKFENILRQMDEERRKRDAEGQGH